MLQQRFSQLGFLSLASILILAVLGMPAAYAQYADLHDFDTLTLASPQYPGLLAQGRDGILYGTAPLGGDFGRGGIFQITPDGAYSVVTSFDGTYGVNPSSGLTLTSDGGFLGAGYYGGAGGFGTAFKMTGPAVSTLHNFINTDGASVYAPPIQGTDGNYYGVTSTGGVAGVGVAYTITSGGAGAPRDRHASRSTVRTRSAVSTSPPTARPSSSRDASRSSVAAARMPASAAV